MGVLSSEGRVWRAQASELLAVSVKLSTTCRVTGNPTAGHPPNRHGEEGVHLFPSWGVLAPALLARAPLWRQPTGLPPASRRHVGCPQLDCCRAAKGKAGQPQWDPGPLCPQKGPVSDGHTLDESTCMTFSKRQNYEEENPVAARGWVQGDRPGQHGRVLGWTVLYHKGSGHSPRVQWAAPTLPGAFLLSSTVHTLQADPCHRCSRSSAPPLREGHPSI